MPTTTVTLIKSDTKLVPVIRHFPFQLNSCWFKYIVIPKHKQKNCIKKHVFFPTLPHIIGVNYAFIIC